jgi:hypothetical protein
MLMIGAVMDSLDLRRGELSLYRIHSRHINLGDLLREGHATSIDTGFRRAGEADVDLRVAVLICHVAM